MKTEIQILARIEELEAIRNKWFYPLKEQTPDRIEQYNAATNQKSALLWVLNKEIDNDQS